MITFARITADRLRRASRVAWLIGVIGPLLIIALWKADVIGAPLTMLMASLFMAVATIAGTFVVAQIVLRYSYDKQLRNRPIDKNAKQDDKEE